MAAVVVGWEEGWVAVWKGKGVIRERRSIIITIIVISFKRNTNANRMQIYFWSCLKR
jgi:hypothetical protein